MIRIPLAEYTNLSAPRNDGAPGTGRRWTPVRPRSFRAGAKCCCRADDVGINGSDLPGQPRCPASAANMPLHCCIRPPSFSLSPLTFSFHFPPWLPSVASLSLSTLPPHYRLRTPPNGRIPPPSRLQCTSSARRSSSLSVHVSRLHYAFFQQ